MIPGMQPGARHGMARGLDSTLNIYRDRSTLLCVLGGRELKRALNRFPAELRRQLQQRASETFLARPGKGVVASYCGSNASGARYAVAWFVGFHGEQENGWAFMEAMPRHSIAEMALEMTLRNIPGEP